MAPDSPQQQAQAGRARRRRAGDGPAAALARLGLALLRASDLDTVARLALAHAVTLPGWSTALLAWSAGAAPGSSVAPLQTLPAQALPLALLERLVAALAVAAPRTGSLLLETAADQPALLLLPLCGRPRLPGDTGPARPWAVLCVQLQSAAAADCAEGIAARRFLRLLRACLPGALDGERVRLELERLQAAERLQQALYAIADLAGAELDMPDLLRGIHAIVGQLMYAENFFIVRYDEAGQTLRFVYFVDSHDAEVPPPDQPIPVAQLQHSLTLATIRLGRALMGPSALLARELGLPALDELGPDSADWLGVPLQAGGTVRGAVVVQSYDPRVRFSEQDRTLLGYVAQHILSALERKQAQEELESRVEQRTRELRGEVEERERGERLQRALFRIAALTGASASLAEFCGAIHAIVGELLYARNFFIALLTEDGNGLTFPYAVDESGDQFLARPLRRGLTEYVLRSGRPLLAQPADSARLIAAGEVERIGTMSECWLGVPLVHGERTVGVLVMQSYTPGRVYSRADQDLLTFVSFHITNALERKQAEDALRRAYTELHATLQRLRQTQKQLVESEKMAALGGLVAGIAHEINTPLGISLTAATHLAEEAAKLQRQLAGGQLRKSDLDGFGHTVLEATDLVVRNLQRADQLVRSFKQVAVDHSVDTPRRMELGAAVADVLKMLGPALRRTPHRVELHCPQPVELLLPGGVLYQLVSNLVMNALQHAFAPGQRGLVVLGIERDGPEVVLSCSDDGVGMDETVRNQIFEPFFTTRRGQGGTGLGLHILYNLVSQVLQGDVRCSSAPGQGSRFEIRWRAEPEPAPAGA